MRFAEMLPTSAATPRRSAGFVRALGMALVVAAFPSTASARPEFPGVVQETLGLDCAPPCTVCHTSPAPDGTNANQPFATNVQLWGAALNTPLLSEDNLPNVLNAQATQPCANEGDLGCAPMGGVCTLPCDANANGATDIADLEAAIDPNPGAKELACPKYGCGARIAPERPSRPIDGAATLVALGAAFVFARRFGRR
jgi:MYXO-CTERM domain-containing protein